MYKQSKVTDLVIYTHLNSANDIFYVYGDLLEPQVSLTGANIFTSCRFIYDYM